MKRRGCDITEKQKEKLTHQNAKVKARYDSVGDGESGEITVTKVVGEGLADDGHAVEYHPRKDGQAGDFPQLLGLLPHLPRQVSLDNLASSPLLRRRPRELREERDIALALHARSVKVFSTQFMKPAQLPR